MIGTVIALIILVASAWCFLCGVVRRSWLLSRCLSRLGRLSTFCLLFLLWYLVIYVVIVLLSAVGYLKCRYSEASNDQKA